MRGGTHTSSSALASPFSAGASSVSAWGSSVFSSSGLAFATSFAFLALGGAYHDKHMKCSVKYTVSDVFEDRQVYL